MAVDESGERDRCRYGFQTARRHVDDQALDATGPDFFEMPSDSKDVPVVQIVDGWIQCFEDLAD
jgi:hypothetical protein